MSVFTTVLLAVASLAASPLDSGRAQSGSFHPYISLADGLQYNVPLPLVIRQSGHPDITLTAHFDTRPFSDVPYYDVKVGMARRSWAFELELVHHKLYLVNRPDSVDWFEITHGYNPLLVNCVHEWGGCKLRAGAGILIAHPETTVRGQRLPQTGGVLGWYLSGPAAQVGVSKSWALGRHFLAGLEGKVVGAWARVPIANGNADVPSLSLHGLASVGWRF